MNVVCATISLYSTCIGDMVYTHARSPAAFTEMGVAMLGRGRCRWPVASFPSARVDSLEPRLH